MSNKGELIKSTDLSSYLTADIVMDALNIETLKEALDMGAPKIVGSCQLSTYAPSSDSTTSISTTLPTTNYDYLEIVSYPVYPSTVLESEPNYRGDGTYHSYSFNETFHPIQTVIQKNQTSGMIPVRYVGNGWDGMGIESAIYPSKFSISGTTLTLTLAEYLKSSLAGTQSLQANNWKWKNNLFLQINLYKY